MSSHLKEFLDYYKTLTNPGYAVLVTGEWGAGKTHQVTKVALKEHEYYYVSLFGLKSTEEIFSAFYAQMHPYQEKAKKFVAPLSGTGANIAGIGSINTGTLIPGMLNAFIKQKIKNERILIFDDLERCKINIEETLGAINFYVEHHECRAIVIAHDEIIIDDIKGKKEKIFGHTIKIDPEIDGVFDEFISHVETHGARQFVNSYKPLIIKIFEDQKEESLRSLRHIIRDLSRIHFNLDNKHIQNKKAMEELIELFVSLDILARRSAISAEDVEHKYEKCLSYSVSSQNKQRPVLLEYFNTSSIPIKSSILCESTLINTLFFGRYIKEEIQNSINKSDYFLTPEDIPPWKIIINFMEKPNEEVNVAIRQVEERLSNFEIDNIGELLHVFALKFLLYFLGVQKKPLDDVLSEGKTYIDRLLDSKKIPPACIELDRPFEQGYSGYAYWVEDGYRDHFDQLKAHVTHARNKSLEMYINSESIDLLGTLSKNPIGFLEKISLSKHSQGDFYRIPILAEIDHKLFFEAWMGLSMEDMYRVLLGLRSRFNMHLQELNKERAWLLNVIQLVRSKSENVTDLDKARLQVIMKHLVPFVNEEPIAAS